MPEREPAYHVSYRATDPTLHQSHYGHSESYDRHAGHSPSHGHEASHSMSYGHEECHSRSHSSGPSYSLEPVPRSGSQARDDEEDYEDKEYDVASSQKTLAAFASTDRQHPGFDHTAHGRVEYRQSDVSHQHGLSHGNPPWQQDVMQEYQWADTADIQMRGGVPVSRGPQYAGRHRGLAPPPIPAPLLDFEDQETAPTWKTGQAGFGPNGHAPVKYPSTVHSNPGRWNPSYPMY